MSALTLRAPWVLPIEGSPIRDGMVAIVDGTVQAVGQDLDPCGLSEELPGCVLLPGLINAHTHLEFSLLEQPLGEPGMPLVEWVREVIAWRTRRGRSIDVAVGQGLRESLAAGVTTVGEIATADTAAYACDPSPRLVMLHEVIGFSRGRVDSVAADLETRLRAVPPQQAVAVGISPHAPYTVHPELLGRLVATAARQNLPVAMHLAESPEELELLAAGTGPFQRLLDERSMWDEEAIPPGSTPADYLKVLAAAPRGLVVHGNYLAESDIALLSQQPTTSVVYCPRTHAYFQHRRYPMVEMLAAGVRVVIGTDSRASSPDLSLLAELQWVAGHFPEIAAERVLRMGTLDAAEALGLDQHIGSIVPGKQADLCAIAVPDLAGDPCQAVLEQSTHAIATWVGGRRVS